MKTSKLLPFAVVVAACSATSADPDPGTKPESVGTEQTYVVLFATNAVPTDAARVIGKAGGSVVASYAPIGVVIAKSTSGTFASTLRRDKRISGAASTAALGVRSSEPDPADLEAAPTIDTPATDSDSLSGLQWDMVQIHTPEAHAITGGSSDVLVADIGTGVDYTHPDIAPNIDFANSASCLGGVPDSTPSAWQDSIGIGTFYAGIIAAASNGIGIVGVAPNVRIAAIRASDANGFFYPEAVICAFMWAASHHVNVANNSYFMDPTLYNCRSDAQQRAVFQATQRAIRYAMSKGVTVVATAGTYQDDLAHKTFDASSPDDTTPVTRAIHNDCVMIPAELPGVVAVSADGNEELKSYYSNYGQGAIAVTAPGGDSILQRTAAAPNGRVLSTWPASLLTSTCPSSQRVVDVSGATYCYFQGSGPASAHASGVAALIASRGVQSVAATLQSTATPLPCPDDISIYAPFPSVNDPTVAQTCTGGASVNSFYGHGQVDALAALGR